MKIENLELKRNNIRKKINLWKDDPLLVQGKYRLYTYLTWDEIDDLSKKYFKVGAEKYFKENENDVLSGKVFENITDDIKLHIQFILDGFNKGQILLAYMYLPVIFADAYALGYGTGSFEGVYKQGLRDYEKTLEIDTLVANITLTEKAIYILKKVLKKISKKGKDTIIEISILDKFLEDNLKNYEKLIAISNTLSPISKDYINKEANNINLNKAIEKALKDYEDKTGENPIKEVSESDIKDLQNISKSN